MVKVGIGPGSICTTRIVAGIGVPQITAIMDCGEVADKYGRTIIADGGIKYSGDITKAIAAGRPCLHDRFAFRGNGGKPGRVGNLSGKKLQVLSRKGFFGAMALGSKDRYFQDDAKKLVPEGVEEGCLIADSFPKSFSSLWADCVRAWDTADSPL